MVGIWHNIEFILQNMKIFASNYNGGEIGSTDVVKVFVDRSTFKVTAKRKSTFASILSVKKETVSSSAQALAAIA